MVVEDDEAMLSLLHTLLQIEGFEVVHSPGTSDLNDILDITRHEKPDLILLDVNLYRLDGFDFLHCLRQDADLKNTRVLMSSGMDFSMRCYQEGADGFILKPYMPDELIEKIHQTIN